MLQLFKKPDPIEKLIKERNKLLEQAFKWSKIDRKKGDELTFEAEQISLKIEELRLAANN